MKEDPQESQVPQRRSPIGSWLLFAVLATMLLAVWLLRSSGSGGTSHPAVGKKLETLDFDPLTDNAQRVTAADLEGKVVVLNFWGTWCKPCRVEFPHIMALEKKHRDHRKFKLLAVSCNAGGPDEVSLAELRESTLEFLASRESDLPAYADLDASVRFGIDRITPFGVYPTTLVLDGKHNIRGMWEGYRQGAEREVEALVDDLLAGK